MLKNGVKIFVLWGLTYCSSSQLTHQSGKYLREDEGLGLSLPEDDWTSVVLLHLNRNRRDTAGLNSTQEQDAVLSQGYSQGDDDFLDNVDIPADQITKNIDKNYKTQNVNTSKYYNFTFHHPDTGKQFFVDLDEHNKSQKHLGKVKEHSMLSQSHRRAATINLSFKFPFYGHDVENITIATGGFLYTGEYVHSWLAATQYIAPLMANFDTSKNQNAKIRYLDTGDFLVVEWKNVNLQDRSADGPFTFQVILHENGNIDFAYRDIPLLITSIQDEDHPVKVGLSDAYIIDKTIFFMRRKTIYEYHRVNLKNDNITSHTAIQFLALDTCNKQKNCTACLRASSGPECSWCGELGKCSDGMDRNRQEWLTATCDKNNVTHEDMCSATAQVSVSSTERAPASLDADARSAHSTSTNSTGGSHMSPGGLTAVITVILLIVVIFGWTGYAYFYPHTTSGQILIKYRPNSWKWRQSGARYTAASIHM